MYFIGFPVVLLNVIIQCWGFLADVDWPPYRMAHSRREAIVSFLTMIPEKQHKGCYHPAKT